MLRSEASTSNAFVLVLALTGCGGRVDSSSSGPDGSSEGSSGGPTTIGTSCQPGGLGLTNCGAGSESCCASLEVKGGTFDRTYTNSGAGPTAEADPATVSGFRLDKYLVTVGRFRQFVSAWSGAGGYRPPGGSGKHEYLNGGQGLTNSGSPATYEPGWMASDSSNLSPASATLSPTNATLGCGYPPDYTWTASVGSNENLPINCVNWYEAYAFCIWDGGFLPSEAEWEYAAAGGSQQREYPWGSMSPGTSDQYAIYGCYFPSGAGDGSFTNCTGVVSTGVANIAPVGMATLGAGLWGQVDLEGNVYEWTLDSFTTSYFDPCTDCADTTPISASTDEMGSSRVIRGSDFGSDVSDLLPTKRYGEAPSYRQYGIGLRCARAP